MRKELLRFTVLIRGEPRRALRLQGPEHRTHGDFPCLSKPDETAYSRVRNGKRDGREITVQILVVPFPIHFCPGLTVQRIFNHTRFHTGGSDCGRSRENAHIVEIPANLNSSFLVSD
jgi:hypothetical protein